jgi:TRAP-type C4-dicarboxylate transport system permease large subunit
MAFWSTFPSGSFFWQGPVLMGLYLIITSYLISKKGLPGQAQGVSANMWALLRSSFTIMMPLIIILGIVWESTPTEAKSWQSSMPFVGLYLREFIGKMFRGLQDSMISSSYIMIILASSGCSAGSSRP